MDNQGTRRNHNLSSLQLRRSLRGLSLRRHQVPRSARDVVTEHDLLLMSKEQQLGRNTNSKLNQYKNTSTRFLPYRGPRGIVCKIIGFLRYGPPAHLTRSATPPRRPRRPLHLSGVAFTPMEVS